MTPLRQRFSEDIQLRGTLQELKRRTRGQSVNWRNVTTSLLTSSAKRNFDSTSLYLANEKKWARASTTIALCGIKFCNEHTLQRHWTTLRYVRPPRETGLLASSARYSVVLANHPFNNSPKIRTIGCNPCRAAQGKKSA